MSTLLVIRSAEEIRTSIEMVNSFLVYRRRRLPASWDSGPVVGIWLSQQLDAGLPPWPRIDQDGGAVTGRSKESTSHQRISAKTLGLRESFSLSGIWALCWIDGTALRQGEDSEERRSAILDWLMRHCDSEATSLPRIFLPVFDKADTLDSIYVAQRQLSSRHRLHVGVPCFVDDPERGILMRQGR